MAAGFVEVCEASSLSLRCLLGNLGGGAFGPPGGRSEEFFSVEPILGFSFESLDGGQAGDAWKEFARESDQVWYVGGTDLNDEITLDFVTEPGILADHHLITRLSENNGHFSFAAQVRLDFEATDEDGNLIWDAQDRVVDALARQAALADSVNTDDGSIVSDGIVQTDLVNGLLPGKSKNGLLTLAIQIKRKSVAM